MTGLVGWWPLHENSGDTARDLSGKGNHGSLNGGVMQGVAGKGGLTAYSFDGSNSEVQIPNDSRFNESKLTVSAWIYIRDLDSSDEGIVSKMGGSDQGWGIMHGYPSDNKITFTVGTGSSYVAAESSPTTGRWHHLVGILNSDLGEAYLFLDGTKAEKISVNNYSSDSNQIAIGAHPNDTWYNDSTVCDVRIYNRALSTQEIQTLYEWGSGDYTDRSYHDGSDSGALSRLRFDGDATDSWASNDGTNNGASFVNNSIRGQAASFDSGDDSIDISKTLLDYTTDFTVSLWLSPDNVTPSEEAQVLMENGREVTMSIKNGEMRHMIYDGSSRLSEGHYNIPASAWTFWTLTWDASTNTGKFYKNGVHNPAGNNDANGNKDHTGFKLGDHPSSGWSYEGLMDDVRIYNRKLNPQEVFQLYQWGTRGRDMRKLTVNKR